MEQLRQNNAFLEARKKDEFDRRNFVKNFSELYPWESVWLMLQIVEDAVLDKHGLRNNPQIASWGEIGANWTPTGNIRNRRKGWFPMSSNFYVRTQVYVSVSLLFIST